MRHGIDHASGFEHEALFYEGPEDYLAATVPFIREGVERGEPVMVAVGEQKAIRLHGRLGRDAAHVRFADMAELGRNPGRIIAAWREFVDESGGSDRPMRGIGEPVWPGRSRAELCECDHHESLLNLAFADAGAFQLLCPYDTSRLSAEVVAAARRNHPHLRERSSRTESDTYVAPSDRPGPFDGELPPAPAEAEELGFDAGRLALVRRLVWSRADRAGLASTRQADLAVAINELATNSVRYAGGRGTLRIWSETDGLVCEVSDDGRLRDPLAGRHRPPPTIDSGRGLWIVHQLCDLVQIRSGPEGTAARVRMDLERIYA